MYDSDVQLNTAFVLLFQELEEELVAELADHEKFYSSGDAGGSSYLASVASRSCDSSRSGCRNSVAI